MPRSPATRAAPALAFLLLAVAPSSVSAVTYLLEWGGFGTANGQFRAPHGLAVAPSGEVYVSDTVNDRVQKFTNNGVYLLKWGSTGSGDGQFTTPDGAAVDADGNVYIASAHA